MVKSIHKLLWTQNLPLFSLFFPCVHVTLPDAVYCYSDRKGRDSVWEWIRQTLFKSVAAQMLLCVMLVLRYIHIILLEI